MNEQTLNEDDLDFIDTVLEKYGSEDSILNASELDGFLTAIISGPDMIRASEWMPAIWGDEDASPDWESKDEVSRFMNHITTLMNQNVDILMDSPGEFEAMLLMDIKDGKPVTVATFWCQGYMKAVMLRPDSWKNLPKDIEKHLENIAAFCTFEDASSLSGLTGEATEESQGKIDLAARALHAYWLKQRAHLAPAANRGALAPMAAGTPMGQVLPFVRKQPKIGPNAPCPCGSGKKHKKCCGIH